MPQTKFISEWLPNGPYLSNYRLESYHKIKPDERIHYKIISTNEIFNILPELHRYTHVTTLSIHILNTKQLENMERFQTQHIQPFQNITTLELTVKVKVPEDIIIRLFRLFPNITRLRLWCSKGISISLTGVSANLQQFSLYAKTISETCIDSICGMNQLNSISIGYENERFPQPYIDKLMGFVTKINANEHKYQPDWLQTDDSHFVIIGS